MAKRLLFLTGFMGTGKSSVGKILSEKLEYPFIDLDAEIVSHAGCSINEIFRNEGEDVFRSLESSELARVAGGGFAVVSTGGGAVICERNRITMRASGLVINLTAPLERIVERLNGADDRPLYAGSDAADAVKSQMDKREQFYADADIRIDTNAKSVEDVAAEIMTYLKGFPG